MEGVSTSSTGRSTGSGPSEGRSRSTYAGERLGRPAEGPGAVAGWGRRLLALTGALATRTPPRVLTPPTPAAAADALVAHLREHGYLR